MARTDQPHKLTFENFVAKSTNFNDPVNEKHLGVVYDKPESRAAWNGSKVKIPLWCGVHSEFFIQQPANHMNGQGCPKCGKDVYKEKRRKTDPVGDFRKVHGDRYDYSRMVYENVQTKIEIVCPEHGPFWQKPNAHLTGHTCPRCWENRHKAFNAQRTVDYKASYAERAARVHNGAYALLSLPENSHDMVRLVCPAHGEFQQRAYSHLDGFGCWSCGQNTNHAQLEVAGFIESLGVRIEHENRTILDGLHIDIWVPEKKIGVEYHGMFWHTEERVGGKHREKYDRSVKAGVRLIQIMDFEWLERRPAVENRLRAIFTQTAAVAARKCAVREVSRSDAKKFFTELHTQGYGSHPVTAYGLYYEDDLVACLSVGMNRFGKEGWEILRYATRGRVQGGFGRLLAKFLEVCAPTTVTSYCDLRWGTGGVYQIAGFQLDGVTPPDYWYVDKRGNRLSRQSVQGRPSGYTERAWVEENGYQKVLGVGHQRWVWRSQHLV